MPIDEFTNLARLSLEIDDLTEEQEAELRDGVDLVITIKDASKNVLEVLSLTKTSFTASPVELVVKGEELEDRTDAVKFRSDVPYYIQLVSADGTTVFSGLDNSDYVSTTGEEMLFAYIPKKSYERTMMIQTRWNREINGGKTNPAYFRIIALDID